MANSHNSPLILDVWRYDCAIVQTCLDLRMDINQVNNILGNSAITHASGEEEMLKFLLKNPHLKTETINSLHTSNGRKMTNLHFCIDRDGDKDFNKDFHVRRHMNIRYLLRAGADPYLKDSEGMDCFARAAANDADPKRLLTIDLPGQWRDANQRRDAQKVLWRTEIAQHCHFDEKQLAGPVMDYIGDDIRIPIDD